MNKCECGNPTIKHRKVCPQCLYLRQKQYRDKWKSAEYWKEYYTAHKGQIKIYNTEKQRYYRSDEYKAMKAAEKRKADAIARRPWHEQEAMRL